jgi:hypothetical protein
VIAWQNSVPAFGVWLAAAAAAALAAYTFWRFAPRDPSTVFLGVIRLAFTGLLAWCMLMPERREAATHSLRPRFLVAVDASASMTRGADPASGNRWAAARAALRERWVPALRATCDIDAFTFGPELSVRTDLARVDQGAPAESSTLLSDALDALARRYKGQDVAALLLLTDGVDTREESNDWTQREWPWPIHALRLEADNVQTVEPDVRVEAVSTPRRVTVGWQTELKATVTAQGTQGRPVALRLLRSGRSLEERPLVIPTEGGTREVTFRLDHPETGVVTYEVRAAPMRGESNTNDNACSTSVQVVDAKNRLLYVEGPPRWESKFLTRVLKANRRVTPICFVRGPGGEFLTAENAGGITPEMTPGQLALLKIVILGNLNAQEIGAARARRLVQFVETGGSLVLLGGSRAWAPDGLPGSELAPVLPARGLREPAVEGKYAVRLTDAGRSHPAFAGDPDLWTSVPPVLSLFPDVAPTPGAQTLVEAQTDAGRKPVLVVHRYGQGKVAAIFTDSLWRWKLDPGAEALDPYRRFWEQLTGWLSPAEEDLKPYSLDLFADRENTFLGDEIELSARFGAGGAGIPESIRVTCELTAPDGRRTPFAMNRQPILAPSGQSLPGYGLRHKSDTPGLHSAAAVARVGERDVRSDPISFFVQAFTPETAPKPLNTAALRSLAARSGGRFHETVAELTEALASLPVKVREEETVRYVTLWQRPWVISCLLLLLCVDWAVRKWRNMP